MQEIKNCPVCNTETSQPWLLCKDHFLSEEIFQIVQCKECGFRYTNPRPETEKLGAYYQSPDYISHSNSRSGLFNSIYQTVRRYTIVRKYQLIRGVSDGKKILDIGCATGEFLKFMKNKGWDTSGIEPDASARQYAVEKNGLKVFDESYMDHIPDNTLDVITLWHVLEHVSGLAERMRTMNRILAPEGILIIAVPNSDSHDAIRYREFWAGFDVPRHLYHFTPDSMKRLLSGFGFRLEKVLPMKFDAFYVSMLSEKYLHGKMSWIKGLLYGWSTNRRASTDGNYSSLIFVSRKENQK